MPTLTSPWRTIASGSNEAFTPGCLPQGQRDGLGHEVAQRELDLLGGELLVQLARGSATSLSTRMSTVTWISGAACLAWTIRWAIVLRIRVCGMRSAAARAAAAAGRPAARRAAAAAAGAAGRLLEERLDVAADDPAAGPAARDLAEVDLRRGGDLAGQRAGLDPAARRPRRRLRRPRLPAVGGRVAAPGRWSLRRRAARLAGGWPAVAASRPPAAAPPPPSDAGDLLGVLALLGQDQHALAQGDLVARRVVEVRDDRRRRTTSSASSALSVSMSASDVPFLDLVADLDQPLGDHPALHRRAELGHRHFDRHVTFSSWQCGPMAPVTRRAERRRSRPARPRLALPDRSASSGRARRGPRPRSARREGSIEASSARLYGIGASLAATRRIGASSSSKAALVDPVGDAGAEAAVGPVFLDDHGAVGLDDRARAACRGRAGGSCGGRSPRRRSPRRPAARRRRGSS